MKTVKILFVICIAWLLQMLSVYAEEIEKYNLCVPVIMYHEIDANSDGNNEYIISPSKLEEDFKQFKSAGFTPITVSEYIALSDLYKETLQATDEAREEKIDILKEMVKKYPNPVLLTFDDGYDDGLSFLFPLLQKYNFKANIAVVGKYTDNSTNFLSREEIKKMSDSGLVEFGNHTYWLHDYPYEWYESFCADTKNKATLLDDFMTCDMILYNVIGKRPSYFAHPYGLSSDISEAVLDEMGVRVSFVTSRTSDFVTLSDGTRKISRINRMPSFQSAELTAGIIRKIKLTSPEYYENFGESIALYIGDEVKKKDIYKITVQSPMYSCDIEGYFENGMILAEEDELEKIEGFSLIKNYGEKTTEISLEDVKILLHYKIDKILSEYGFDMLPEVEKGVYPIRHLFESLGYEVIFKADEKQVLVREKGHFYF